MTDPGADSLFDRYLDQALRGEIELPERFCARHGVADGELLSLLSGLSDLLSSGTKAAGPTPELTPREDLPWAELGEHRLLRRLGSGAMGLVFLAEQKGLGRLVAVKVIQPSLLAARSAVERFEREARALASLQHPSIVTVFGCGAAGDVRYLVMEYIPGRGLDDLLRGAGAAGEPVAIPRLLAWTAQIARALAAVHAAGLLHRDVKPANVRIRPDDRAVLVDFGLVKDLVHETPTLTKEFAGSPAYAAPEQLAQDHAALDARTDIYALGVTLYEGLVGRVPFAATSIERQLHAMRSMDAIAPRALRADVPPDVETIVLRTIAPRPADRYASAALLADDLEAVLALRPITARPLGWGRRAVHWAMRRRATAALVAVLLLVVVSAAVAVLVQAAAQRGERRAEVEALTADARAALTELETLRASYEKTAWQLVGLQGRQRHEWLDPAKEGELLHSESLLAESRRTRELLYARVLDALAKLARLAPGLAESDAIRSGFWFQKWLDVRRSDAGTAELYASLVTSADPDGSWSKKVAGKRRVTIGSEPAADAFLFRYVAATGTGGAGPFVPRLVPVAGQGARPPLEASQCALVVLRRAGSLAAGTLVDRVAGHPIGGAVLVARPGTAGVDRVLSIGGVPVASLGDALALAGSAPWTIQRADQFVEVAAGSSAELTTPERLVHSGFRPLAARVREPGGTRDVDLPHGIEVRTTAAALPLDARAALGRTPLTELELPPGAYVVVLRAAGHEDLRVPFHVDHSFEHYSHDQALRARLSPLGTTPPGYVRVACDAYPWVEEGFLIMECEVTCAEYREFLVALEREGGAPATHAPRHENGRPWWTRDPESGWVLPADASEQQPVRGISWLDAMAFVAWKNRAAPGGGARLRYDLPTQRQWSRAAHGGDGRALVYGDTFWPKAAASRFAYAGPRLPEVRSHPCDESPFAVYDLSGSVSEWCKSEAGSGRRLRAGGSFLDSEPEAFRIESFRSAAEHAVDPAVGFRLVAVEER